MALANVAWALASNRQKVLVIDWDLEAPGLHRYFRPFLADRELTEPESKGLIDFVRNYAMLAATPPAEGTRPSNWYEPHAQIWRWAMPLRWPGGSILNFGPGEIQFVPAGRQGADYAERVNTFDWYELYQAHGGNLFFQSVREQAKREFDYVLIDSRTGVSDTSGICTIQMPDILVACYTYNMQSILGASDIAGRVLNKRPGLAVFPIAMRVEFTETDSLIPMRKLARERFGDLVSGTSQQDYFDRAEIPYYPKYSFFEKLAAFEEFPNAGGSINANIRHLASLITGGQIVQAPIDEARRGVVAGEFEPEPKKIVPIVASPARPIPVSLKWAAIAWAVLFPLLLILIITAWGRLPQPEPVSVTVDPPAATLAAADQLQLAATVHGLNEPNVIWTATLGKISSSGLYVAPGAVTDKITDTITATSVADRSQSGSAFFTLTKSTRFRLDPASATLKPGEQKTFVVIGSEFLRGSGASWQLSPQTGALGTYRTGQATITYRAPPGSFARQRVILSVSSPGNDASASAGIELTPESSPLGRWAYLILAAAAGALGSYVTGTSVLVRYIGNRVFRTEWWAHFALRPIFGAALALMVYEAVAGGIFSGSGQSQNPFGMASVAFLVGLFSDQAIRRLQDVMNTLFRPVDDRKKPL